MQRHDDVLSAQYVYMLCEMLTVCEFGNAEQDMLQDQIMEKAYGGCIHTRLLLEDKLTLDKAIQIANHVEWAARDASTLSVKWCRR